MQHPTSFVVRVGPSMAVTALAYETDRRRPVSTLVLAHGAGAGQSSPFLVDFARALASLGSTVVTFNFPYIEQRRRIPDRQPVLENCYRAIIDAIATREGLGDRPLLIGGKSMGGRIATHIAAADANLAIRGLVLLGYPLHPPGRPTQRRDRHLPTIRRPMLVVQGGRDAFGTPAELRPALEGLSPPGILYVVTGGDHSFKVSGATKAEQAAVYDDVQRTVMEWVQEVVAQPSTGTSGRSR